MSYNTEQLALVIPNLHFRYVKSPFGEESLENLENLQITDSIEEIPISWVEAWESDVKRRHCENIYRGTTPDGMRN